MEGRLDNESLFDIHQSVVRDQMEFLYKGHINNEIINVLLEIVKKKFQDFDVDYSLRKKIYNIGVECLENIRDHGVEKAEKDSIFVIGKSDDDFYLSTGNVVKKEEVRKLSEKLDRINGLNREELKQLYKDIINEESGDNPNEVGLGLIDIAMKANNNIEYGVVEVSEDHDFFSFQVKINLVV